ncbi:MAG: hypothetical protein IT250_15530 [Chitinophagaceae bacterium]|nr:hypothetical protein [Chitinophagaceae bacterium]
MLNSLVKVAKYALLFFIRQTPAILLTGATFSALFSNMLNIEQAVEECDATGFHSSNIAWVIIKLHTKYRSDL